MITRKLSRMLIPLLSVLLFASCVQEREYGQPAGNSKEVLFTMRIPGIATATSRALSPTEEYAVTTFDVLVFENGGTLLSRSTHVGTPKTSEKNGKKYADFVVKLEPKDGITLYDFYMVANARELINTALYSGGKLREGMTKTEVQEALKLTLSAGTAWDTDTKKTLPMWGQLTAQPIQANYKYDNAVLTRMVAKIDLSVALTNASDDFQLSEVWLYNYQKQGYVAPKAGQDADGTDYFNGKAYSPSIESGWAIEKTTPIDYTDMISGNAISNEIYVFEAAEGSPANSDYMNNICLVVGGTFNGTKGFYRLDFANMDAVTHTPSYMPILRNYHYKVAITAINGPGFETKEEAYNSKPVNVGTEIAKWEDGEFIEGEWNGNYNIQFTSKIANFDMFGAPKDQVIKIKTNVPDLKFASFQDKVGATGRDDAAEWTESPTGTWTNNHFHVKIEEEKTGETYIYTLTVNADPTIKDGAYADPFREAWITVTGKGMTGKITITQSEHITFFLSAKSQLDVENTRKIDIDGSTQLIPFEIISTHPYDIEMTTPSMLTKIYSKEDKSEELANTQIPVTVSKVWIEVTEFNSIDPRVATITFKQNKTISPETDANSVNFTVVQMKPMIEAQIKGGTYATSVKKEGEDVTITVNSNLPKWIATVDRQVGTDMVETDFSSALTFFTPAADGSYNGEVTFNPGALVGDKYVVYTIRFKDNSGGTAVSEKAITITHKAKVPGEGGGGTPPNGGVLAPEGILAVDKEGILNLDGPAREGNYIVYYKWGSTVAVAGSNSSSDMFDSGDVAWVPEGYDFNGLIAAIDGEPSNLKKWSTILLPTKVEAFPADDPANGWGDPCKLAVKNGKVGNFKMPEMIENPSNTFTYPYAPIYSASDWSTYNGYWYNKGKADQKFYPVAGYRASNTGMHNYVSDFGYYWSATSSSNINNSFCLIFTSSDISPDSNGNKEAGYVVRCVATNP